MKANVKDLEKMRSIIDKAERITIPVLRRAIEFAEEGKSDEGIKNPLNEIYQRAFNLVEAGHDLARIVEQINKRQ